MLFFLCLYLRVRGLSYIIPTLEKTINNIPGVVTNGIFALNKADIATVATNNGIEERFAV